ncbi:SCP2 sterol-binding domain-containing protein [Thermanaerothrix sp. 4228-RoL]|uniref:SCP2 sterol-binding domain-containing protein n=1 Tax=Thermanaerothrix solaris TaxID=3058434 RepID=A0ABU3NIX3_9CHLR|nr:SCP2 sterol-binding domain-containing protein [Thermanaerothrix sp. 4228-RoL]MDT8896816.1 SCP2 sterol-binding domain-containing protein [Thermanaerothrix sp. 4228-RoL]
MDEITIRDIMLNLPRAFSPENAQDVRAVVQLHVTGDEPGDWVIRIQEGQCEVNEGQVAGADLVFTAEARDLLEMLHGRLNPLSAYMMGRLDFRGNSTLAMKLPSLFAKGMAYLKQQRGQDQ